MRESAANEAITMRTAAYCGLSTAKVFYERLTHACIVERFDRFTRADGTLGRLIQVDFCQIAGTESEKKHEKEGGPALRNARRSSAATAPGRPRTCRPLRSGSSSISTPATTTATPRTSRYTSAQAKELA